MNIATVFVLILLIAVRPAHAYLDPSSGSMLVQLLLGGVAGLGVILKLYWNRLLALFGMRRAEPASTDAKADSQGT